MQALIPAFYSTSLKKKKKRETNIVLTLQQHKSGPEGLNLPAPLILNPLSFFSPYPLRVHYSTDLTVSLLMPDTRHLILRYIRHLMCSTWTEWPDAIVE